MPGTSISAESESARRGSKFKATSDDSATLSGTMQARFVNGYSPMHDTPFEALQLTSDRYLDQELCNVLLEDRRESAQFHRTSDKKFKEFLLQKWRNDLIQKEFDRSAAGAKAA